MLQTTPVSLVACPDIASYRQAIREIAGGPSFNSVPFIIPPLKRLRGFPPEQPVISFADWQAARHSATGNKPAPAISAGTEAVCYCTPDPLCRAAAELLCHFTGKTLVVCEKETDWEQTGRELILKEPLSSLTFVVPSWNNLSKKPEPDWVLRVLDLIREPELERVSGRLSWGIITGPDAASLTALVVKAILQDRITAHYRGKPAAVLTTYSKEDLDAPIPYFQEAGDETLFELVDRKVIGEGSAPQSVRKSWSAFIFKGHGRNYCALDGYMCGARNIEQDPETPPASCILGMQCYDPAFPQLDPRRFDTPVMVMDSCGTGNWASYAWDTGVPSLGFLATGGAPGAIITGDGATINSAADFIEVVYALIRATTMGEATSILNEVRRNHNDRLPFYLLGDPDTGAGRERWPEWVEEIKEYQRVSPNQIRVDVAGGRSPYLCLALPEDAGLSAQHSLFVWEENDGIAPGPAWLFKSRKGYEVWLGAEKLPVETQSLLMEWGESPAMPQGMAEAALEIPGRLMAWKEPLQEAVLPVLKAAKQALDTGNLLEEIHGQAITFSPEIVEGRVFHSVIEWIDAHLFAVNEAFKFKEASLWPFSLWNAYNYTAERVDIPCPHCQLSPTILRTYQTAPHSLLDRHWLECMRCDVVQDWPVSGNYPPMAVRVPATITPGETTAHFELDNRQGKADFNGAAFVVMDRSGHGVSSTPEVFPVTLKQGEIFRTRITLNLQAAPPVTHQYRVRALAFLNGQWLWASRTVIVKG